METLNGIPADAVITQIYLSALPPTPTVRPYCIFGLGLMKLSLN